MSTLYVPSGEVRVISRSSKRGWVMFTVTTACCTTMSPAMVTEEVRLAPVLSGMVRLGVAEAVCCA